MAKFSILSGPVSPETAHVVHDYPYGRRLRCKMRYWVETRKGFGQRFMRQSTNPKVSNEVFSNAPKGGTYGMLTFLYVDPTTGYVEQDGIGGYPTPEKLTALEEKYEFDAETKERFDRIVRLSQAQCPGEWTRFNEMREKAKSALAAASPSIP